MNRPELRIGDAERDAAVSVLGEHYVAGRLTKDEYDERSAVAWKARTNSDLAPLFVDLPPLPQSRRAPVPAIPATRPQPGHRPGRDGARFPLLPLIAILVGIAMLTEWWVVLMLVGVLWWAGLFRWLHGVTTHQRRR